MKLFDKNPNKFLENYVVLYVRGVDKKVIYAIVE